MTECRYDSSTIPRQELPLLLDVDVRIKTIANHSISRAPRLDVFIISDVIKPPDLTRQARCTVADYGKCIYTVIVVPAVFGCRLTGDHAPLIKLYISHS